MELATEDRSRGVWTLRGGVELGVSTSSTSKDLFKAGRQSEEKVISRQLGNAWKHPASGERQKAAGGTRWDKGARGKTLVPFQEEKGTVPFY